MFQGRDGKTSRRDERVRRRVGLLIAASVAALFLIATPVAAASPNLTLSGAATLYGDHPADSVEVNAYLSDEYAGGWLKTRGWQEEDEIFTFEGPVTCMTVSGNQVVVGSLGHAKHEFEWPGSEEQFPGEYEQVVSIEYGDFGPRPGAGASGEATLRFHGLGGNDDGIPASAAYSWQPSDCQNYQTFGGSMWPESTYGGPFLSPEITSPTNESTVAGTSVTLAGTGQADATLDVYEVGEQSSGHLVAVNSAGQWSTTFTGVSAATHVYTASTVAGSSVTAPTVQVNVNVPPPPPLSVFKTANEKSAEWESLASQGASPPEWGYKVAVSNLPRNAPDRITDYFEVERGTDPQTFTPVTNALSFTPIEGQVYVGVGALAAPGTSPTAYSANEALVKATATAPPSLPAPTLSTTSNGQSVLWDSIGAGEWGYVVAISNLPRGTSGRVTDYVAVQRSTDPQSFTPNPSSLTFAPIAGQVYVAVGTVRLEGEEPGSYSASEVALTLPAVTGPPVTLPTTLPSGSGSSTPAPGPGLGRAGAAGYRAASSIALTATRSALSTAIRTRRLTFALKSSTAGKLAVTGYLAVKKLHRRLAIDGKTLAIAARRPAHVVLSLPGATLRQLRAAKARHENATANLTLTLHTTADETRTQHATLHLN